MTISHKPFFAERLIWIGCILASCIKLFGPFSDFSDSAPAVRSSLQAVPPDRSAISPRTPVTARADDRNTEKKFIAGIVIPSGKFADIYSAFKYDPSMDGFLVAGKLGARLKELLKLSDPQVKAIEDAMNREVTLLKEHEKRTAQRVADGEGGEWIEIPPWPDSPASTARLKAILDEIVEPKEVPFLLNRLCASLTYEGAGRRIYFDYSASSNPSHAKFKVLKAGSNGEFAQVYSGNTIPRQTLIERFGPLFTAQQ